MKQTHIPIKTVNIDNDGFHLHVKVLLNGKTANMVLDTGASRTVFDIERIKKFVKEKAELHDKLSSGLGTNTMQSHKIKIKKLKLGSLTINNYESVLLDLSHVNNSYKQVGLKPIDGILGGDILQKHKATISYQKKLLNLR